MKKKVIIIGSIVLVAIVVAVSILLLTNKKNKKVTISFDTNGGEYESAIKIDKGTAPTLPKVEREGYVFLGWYTEDGEEVDSKTAVTSDIKLVAKWQKEEDCPVQTGGTSNVVKFNTNGGTAIDNLTICTTCAPETVVLPTPKKNGYTFLGWYADSQLTKKVEGGKNNVTNATWTRVSCTKYETTIYAKWQKN